MTILQELPLFGALIAAALAFIYSFFNGYKEKQEGKRIGRAEVEAEHRALEIETNRQLKGQEDETRRTTTAVDRAYELLRRDRERIASSGGMPDEAAPIPDYNFRD
jgi:hypothetical protein